MQQSCICSFGKFAGEIVVLKFLLLFIVKVYTIKLAQLKWHSAFKFAHLKQRSLAVREVPSSTPVNTNALVKIEWV